VLPGPVRTENLSWISPLLAGLLNALQEVVPVEWEVAPSGADHTWFRWTVKPIDRTNDPTRSDIVSCADPRHEAVESLRWGRELLSARSAKSREIAIAAPSPSTWDEHFLGLRANTGLRIHFLARCTRAERERWSMVRSAGRHTHTWRKQAACAAPDCTLCWRTH
jgi:hypothetical protein